MDELLSEKEQIDQMRAWWSEYGRYVIAGVVVAVALLIGFNRYQSGKFEAQLQASQLYEALADRVADGDVDAAEAVADDLANNYANTAYAAQSKLAMARLYMDGNRDQDAAVALNELLALPGNDELKGVGRLRLARILLYQDKADEVVALLSDQDVPAFAALNNELLGDAYVAIGDVEKAGDAYRAALADTAANPTVNRGLVQMKLADLAPVSTADGEAAGDEAAGDEAVADQAPAAAGTKDEEDAEGEAGETE